MVIVLPTQSNRGRLRSLWARSRPATIAAVTVGVVLWAMPYAAVGGAAIAAAVVGSNFKFRCLLLAGCIAIAGVLLERFLRRRAGFWLPVRALLDRYQTRERSQGGRVVIEIIVAADKVTPARDALRDLGFFADALGDPPPAESVPPGSGLSVVLRTGRYVGQRQPGDEACGKVEGEARRALGRAEVEFAVLKTRGERRPSS
jgi:hypothetical protein